LRVFSQELSTDEQNDEKNRIRLSHDLNNPAHVRIFSQELAMKFEERLRIRHNDRQMDRLLKNQCIKDYIARKPNSLLSIVATLHRGYRLRGKDNPRYVKRQEKKQIREEIDGFLDMVAEMNETLRCAEEGILIALGYRKHDRSEWRMMLDSASLIQQWLKGDTMNAQSNNTEPVNAQVLPVNEGADIELLARARAGDAKALNRVQILLQDGKWVERLGNLGQEATNQLVSRVAGRDPVKKSGFAKYTEAIYAELLGDKPSVLEKLLVRRVINNWISVNSLELELAECGSDRLARRSFLDKAITRAQKRYTEAINELMRVRRLQAPRFLAQVTSVSEKAVNDSTPRGE
jgi:hypothetical protein